MNHLKSMYIDNELSLGEKILFLEHVHENKPYKDDAVDLLEQEELLSGALNKTAPAIELNFKRTRILPLLNRSLGWAIAACLLIVLSFTVDRQDLNPQLHSELTTVTTEPTTVRHRFVIHNQETQSVEIAGSFTNWQNVPLIPSGTNGYWEISLELPAGEHRYTFIIDGSEYLPDPTIATQESDDFGSTNSILKVEA